MASITKLPAELLRKVIAYLPKGQRDLLSCSLTSRTLWTAATPVMYRDIDLDITERYDEDEHAVSLGRQLRLLQSISENPRLGAQVRSFANYHKMFGDGKDVTTDEETDPILLAHAARNMINLTKASLTPNHMSAQIIANLPDYKELSDLNVLEINPRFLIWPIVPTNLRSLRWICPIVNPGDSSWDSAKFLITVAESTCPELESLEISSSTYHKIAPELPPISPDLYSAYGSLPPADACTLPRLRHFGFKHLYRFGADHAVDREVGIQEVVERYSHTLQSISLSINNGGWSRETLDFVLKVCSSLPNLKHLALTESNGGQEPTTALDALEGLQILTNHPATSKLESFSLSEMDHHFNADFGRAFQSWKNLKSLRVGAANEVGSPYGNDGRPDFDDYRSDIMGFIESLPPSLQELYLEVNGEDLSCDDDSDFDPIADMGCEIFTSKRRLHTCDIHAWISNHDGGLGFLPEKAVFFRRLPHDMADDASAEKQVWTSRMDCIYQDDDILVEKNMAVLDLGKGAFEGEDAEEVWLDGYVYAIKTSHGTGRGRPADKPDYTWPHFVEKVASYDKFRQREH